MTLPPVLISAEEIDLALTALDKALVDRNECERGEVQHFARRVAARQARGGPHHDQVFNANSEGALTVIAGFV